MKMTKRDQTSVGYCRNKTDRTIKSLTEMVEKYPECKETIEDALSLLNLLRQQIQLCYDE